MNNSGIPMMRIKTIVNDFIQIKKNNAIICFDYFDTLVSRTVAPEYTKQIASYQLCRLLKNQITEKRLYEIRSNLEVSICNENRDRGLSKEFNLKTLGDRLFDDLNSNYGCDLSRFTKEDFVSIILNIEIAVEKVVQRPYPDMISLLKSVKAKHATTILVSDFYLPKKYFNHLLCYHKLDQLFDHVYISADVCVTKGGEGRLYEKIIQDLNINRKQMLMIGDNPHADNQVATDRGIYSLLIDRRNQKDIYKKWEINHNRNIGKFHPNSRAIIETIRNHGGSIFPQMGVILWWFVWKLFERLIHDDVKVVFFLSREGELLKKIFMKLQSDLFGCQIIKSNYLLASRKSTYIASLKSLPKEDFSKLFFQYRDISTKDFLLSLNFSENEISKIHQSIGGEINKKVTNFPDSSIFNMIVSNDIFKTCYERNRSKQKENFIRYLSSFDSSLDRKVLHLVEVGWKGSIQENIFDILDRQTKITGYYIGLLSSPIQHHGLEKNGILFTEIPTPSTFMAVYNNNRSLFEMILGASHGSAEGYFTSNEEITKRSDPFMKDNTIINDKKGDLIVTTTELPEEKKLFIEIIQPFQEKVLKIASELNQRFILPKNRLPDKKFFARQHARMTFLPRKKEIVFFEKLYHLENFGVFEFTKFHHEKRVGLRKKIFNLKSVIVDPAILEIGFWPPVILRHLGIGFYRHIDGFRRMIKNFGLSGILCKLPFF